MSLSCFHQAGESVLLDLRDIVKDHQLDIGGVVHVGAHTGEEAVIYDLFGNPSGVLD